MNCFAENEASFGFEYEYQGKRYAAHIVAASRSEAEGRIAALAAGRCIGELHEEGSGTSPTPRRSAPSKPTRSAS